MADMARLKYHQTILKILWEDHLTADDIYDVMRKKYGRIGIATIYRTLEHLVDTKEVTKLIGVFDKAYFEKNKWPHIHFVDKQVYKIIDVPVSNYDFIPKQEWFSISYADIIVYGTMWNSIASGLFSSPKEEWNNIVVEKDFEENIHSIDNIQEDIAEPFFAPIEESLDVVENEQKNTEVDTMDIYKDLESSNVSEVQWDAINPIDSSQNTSPIEEGEKKQQEDEKKKRRELKNIFRQF